MYIHITYIYAFRLLSANLLIPIQNVQQTALSYHRWRYHNRIYYI